MDDIPELLRIMNHSNSAYYADCVNEKGGAFDLKAPPGGGLQGARTQIDSDIDFCGIKNRNIDISMFFCFAKAAKNAIFGSLPLRSGYNSDKLHFNAWFMPSVGNF